mgnify:CR=1 FL=1
MRESLQRVREMLDRATLIEQICAENGGIVKSLQDSKLAQPAIIMHLIVIQEQIAKLQDNAEFDILNRFSRASLRGLATIRNIASHDYEGLNFSIIKEVIRSYLPAFKKELQGVLGIL